MENNISFAEFGLNNQEEFDLMNEVKNQWGSSEDFDEILIEHRKRQVSEEIKAPEVPAPSVWEVIWDVAAKWVDIAWKAIWEWVEFAKQAWKEAFDIATWPVRWIAWAVEALIPWWEWEERVRELQEKWQEMQARWIEEFKKATWFEPTTPILKDISTPTWVFWIATELWARPQAAIESFMAEAIPEDVKEWVSAILAKTIDWWKQAFELWAEVISETKAAQFLDKKIWETVWEERWSTIKEQAPWIIWQVAKDALSWAEAASSVVPVALWWKIWWKAAIKTLSKVWTWLKKTAKTTWQAAADWAAWSLNKISKWDRIKLSKLWWWDSEAEWLLQRWYKSNVENNIKWVVRNKNKLLWQIDDALKPVSEKIKIWNAEQWAISQLKDRAKWTETFKIKEWWKTVTKKLPKSPITDDIAKLEKEIIANNWDLSLPSYRKLKQLYEENVKFTYDINDVWSEAAALATNIDSQLRKTFNTTAWKYIPNMSQVSREIQQHYHMWEALFKSQIWEAWKAWITAFDSALIWTSAVSWAAWAALFSKKLFWSEKFRSEIIRALNTTHVKKIKIDMKNLQTKIKAFEKQNKIIKIKETKKLLKAKEKQLEESIKKEVEKTKKQPPRLD